MENRKHTIELQVDEYNYEDEINCDHKWDSADTESTAATNTESKAANLKYNSHCHFKKDLNNKCENKD